MKVADAKKLVRAEYPDSVCRYQWLRHHPAMYGFVVYSSLCNSAEMLSEESETRGDAWKSAAQGLIGDQK